MTNRSTCTRAGALALALLLGAAAGATAQDDIPQAEPVPEQDPLGDSPTGRTDSAPAHSTGRDSVTPAQTEAEEEPRGAGHRRNPGPGFGADRTHVRLRWDQYRVPVEIDQFRDSANVLGLGFGSRGLNRRTDWELEKTSMRLEAGHGFGGEDLQFDLYGGLGWGWTELGLDADKGSDLFQAGPAVAADFDSDIDFDLSLGADVWAFVTDTVFVGVGYQFLFSHASYDHQAFLNGSVIDGESNITLHDLTGRVGVRINRMVSVWGGAGITAVWGEFDVEPKRTTADVEFEVENEAWVKGVLGFSLHPGDNVVGSFEAQFMPEPTFRMSLGWSF